MWIMERFKTEVWSDTMKQKETIIRNSIVSELRRSDWFVIYNMQMGFGQHKGLADLTCMRNGEVVFVEIKTETGKQSAEQVQFQKDCESHGVKYLLARSVSDVQEMLNYQSLFEA